MRKSKEEYVKNVRDITIELVRQVTIMETQLNSAGFTLIEKLQYLTDFFGKDPEFSKEALNIVRSNICKENETDNLQRRYMETQKYHEEVSDIINGDVRCPLPLEVIPNHMGINLSSVKSIEWEKRTDGQLVNLMIHFTPSP